MYRDHRVVAVIQARMGSKRLQNKVLLSLRGRPVLWHVIDRLQRIPWFDRLVVATSTHRRDDVLVNYVAALDDPQVEVVRGPERDVLARFYRALESFDCQAVVRVTADSPLLSVKHLDRMIARLVDGDLDGVDAHRDRTGLTLGFGTEIYRRQAIVDAHLLAVRPDEREHVTLFVKRRPSAFRIEYPTPDDELCSNYRLTLDYPEDYRLLRRIYRQLYRPGEIVDCRRVIRWLDRHPEQARINAHRAQKTP